MRILVPTDFSKFADYAFNAAIKLAKVHGGEIHLFHAADIPSDWQSLSVELKYKDKVNKSIALYARDRMEELRKRAESEKIFCEHHYNGGKLVDNVADIVDRLSVDLIVMGSHGTSGKEEWFIGSNTQKVVRRIRKQLLVVKNPMITDMFRNVVFVSNLSEEDQVAFKHFLDFLKPYKSVMVHILSIDTLGWFNQPGVVIKEAFKEFESLALGFKCKTHFYKDYSVDAGIRHFCKEKQIELVAISNHNRNPIKRFFQGSNVEMLVNHSEVPVLSIDYS